MDSVRTWIQSYTMLMKLGIDIREACRKNPAGKGRWTLGFVSELLQITTNVVLYTDAPLPLSLRKIATKTDVRIINKRGLFWHLGVARDVLRDASIDGYVSTISYIVPCIIRRKKPVITIVHDLIAFRNEKHDRRSSFIEHITAKIAFRHSALICTVSETTAADLRATFTDLDSSRIVPIFAGSSLPIATKVSDGNGPVLCIGTLCPRKNQLRLIQAHAMLPEQLRKKHPLVLVGNRGWDDQDIVDAATGANHVTWKKYVSDDERDALLRDAIVFALPSLYEGFGLPVLEAFCAGVPVLTSDKGSLKEIAADAALTVDPLDHTSIAKKLEQVLSDADLRRSLASKGLKRAHDFSWGKTVKLFQKALSHIDSTL
jgi:glycosyltransferase involved in cell wall biosynthesis